MGYFRENVEEAEGYVPGYQPQEADATKLNTNENPYPPSPEVMKVLASVEPEQLRRYPDPVGNAFRKAAAEVNGVGAENIMCCNGGDDLLSIAFRAFCDAQRAVVYPVPTYSLYAVLARLQDCTAVEIPFDEEFNLPAKLASSNGALTIVCNPNAPTGTMVNIEELTSLADELKGILLVDEAYVDFAENTCASLVKDFDNVIVLRSMSKGYSLAGIRFGYAIGQPDLIDGLMKLKDSYNVDAVAIALATAAIKDRKYHDDTVEKVKQQRTMLTEKLRGLGFDVPESFANFLLADCKSRSASEIYNKLIQRKIYVRYFNVPGLDNRLRITIGTKDQNTRLIDALDEILS